MNAFKALIGLACLALAVGVIVYMVSPQTLGFTPQATPADDSALVTAFSAGHASDFITYRNSNYSFSVKDAIGKKNEEFHDAFTVARLSGSTPVGAEVIEIRTTNAPLTEEEWQGIFNETAGDVFNAYQTEINNRRVQVFESTEYAYFDYPVAVKAALIECPEYAAAVSVAMPSAFVPSEEGFAEFVIASFQC